MMHETPSAIALRLTGTYVLEVLGTAVREKPFIDVKVTETQQYIRYGSPSSLLAVAETGKVLAMLKIIGQAERRSWAEEPDL